MIIHRNSECIGEGPKIRVLEIDAFSLTVEFSDISSNICRVSMTWSELAFIGNAIIEWLQLITGNTFGALVSDLGVNIRPQPGEPDYAYRRRVIAVLQQAIRTARNDQQHG